MYTVSDYQKSAEYIKRRLAGFAPETLIILGSGLGALAEEAEEPIEIPYGEIPNFVQSTVMGHRGRFVAGKLSGKSVLMMQGRFHMYEGYSAEQVAFPVRVAFLLGIKSLIVTNAAGSVNADFHEGSLMLISDFIRFGNADPLTGPNMEEFGVRFPDMTYVFDKAYMRIFTEVAAKHGELVHEGVYFQMPGPRYETPAEIRAIRALGGDAVGMSTVQEVIAARHCGMKTLGISLLANMAAGMLDKPLTGEEVIAAAEAAGARFRTYIKEFLGKMQ